MYVYLWLHELVLMYWVSYIIGVINRSRSLEKVIVTNLIKYIIYRRVYNKVSLSSFPRFLVMKIFLAFEFGIKGDPQV